MNTIINQKDWDLLHLEFIKSKPFNHVIIDNFFVKEVAEEILKEFPEYDSPVWDTIYNNPLENKKAGNHWNRFPKTTYKVFDYLCSRDFENIVEKISKHPRVYADKGLHGGGWHGHSKNGNLNVHLDYSIHPKLGMERHYNLIVYMTPDWNPDWGGGLELWSHNYETGLPDKMITCVENKFNRAVLFDTTQNSWHGLPKHLSCPEGTFRRSLAIYYVTDPAENASPRPRAKFAPYGNQIKDEKILELIEQRQKL